MTEEHRGGQIEEVENIQKSSSETEKEVSEKVFEKIKDEKVSDSKLDEIIFKEIENNLSFSEDWQKHYAKERIKNVVKKLKFNFLPTARTKRLLNAILDCILLLIWVKILYFVIGINELISSIAISILYYVIFESIWSKTPAKFITKTKVITEYGEKPNLKTIFVRTLIRNVPFEAFSFLGSQHPRGWHDRWSKTIVINDVKE